MRILIFGGSGFIGQALTVSMLAEGHQVGIVTRNVHTNRLIEGAYPVGWDGLTTTGWGEKLSAIDAVINLAGESLGAGYWTRAKKSRILSSRVNAGKAITVAIRQADPRPQVLIQASAVGIYGPLGTQPITEESAPGQGFQAEVCKSWEASTQPVEDLGVRRVVIRTGVVLSKSKGALPRIILPFLLYAGGPLGNGMQGFPWIHPVDEVAAIRFLLENDKARGVFNLCAPEPLSNSDFGRILAKELHRPFWLQVPGIALRLLLGEMSTLVLEGQYMLPKRLQDLGFHFHFPNAEAALHDLLASK